MTIAPHCRCGGIQPDRTRENGKEIFVYARPIWAPWGAITAPRLPLKARLAVSDPAHRERLARVLLAPANLWAQTPLVATSVMPLEGRFRSDCKNAGSSAIVGRCR